MEQHYVYGWWLFFFLTVCESFVLGDKEYRLPGIGAYMARAIAENNTKAITAAIIAMACIVIFFDLLIWRPALSFVYKYRLENSSVNPSEERILNFIFRTSTVIKLLRHLKTYSKRRPKFNKLEALSFRLPNLQWGRFFTFIMWPLRIISLIAVIYGALKLFHVLSQVSLAAWLTIAHGTFLTFIRVLAAVLIATLWTLPAGIWISRSGLRMRIAQPISQLLASFPAPMLYPLVLALTFKIGIAFEFSSMLLIFLGVQWYVLFNTLAGGLRISKELEDSLNLMRVSKKNIWRYLYIPSVFPALVTGWISAAGGAWNASIVAEYLFYQGQTIQTLGLGSLISQSAASADLNTLAACLTVMVVTVILVNRLFWSPIYKISQTRYRLDF